MLINVIGFLASCISFILWMPQAAIVWKSRKNPVALSGVSVATQFLVLTNASLWGLYAVLTTSFWVGAPGIINAPLAIMTIALVMRARRAPTSASPVQEELDEGALLPA